MIQQYLKNVRISGIKELEEVLSNREGDGNKINCLMKTKDVEYYIFGVLGEPFPNDNGYWVLNLGNSFLSFITLNIYPSISRHPLRVNFYIYDSKLNRIDDL
ncbi:hypothetical protein O4O04_08165 [Leptospira sp. GIMC2001]|nr:hypothetical protein [Leptospira sp. GIMC2001]WCL50773.1 hypothetical protein O4O04_08165 [Leptospira sp. GIMC2001]